MDKKISNIKERILYITDFKEIAKEKFFEEIGMTYGSFKGKQKKTALNSDAIDRILSIYTDIDANWLLTGKGDMLKQSKDYITEENPPPTLAEEQIFYKEKVELLQDKIALLQENKALLERENKRLQELDAEIKELKIEVKELRKRNKTLEQENYAIQERLQDRKTST